MSNGWSIRERLMMSAKMSRDLQYFCHIFLKYLRWATFVLSLKVTTFIILEKSRGGGHFCPLPPPPPTFQIGPPKKPVLLRVKNTSSYETGISDHHHLIFSIMKTTFAWEESKKFVYCDYKTFSHESFKMIYCLKLLTRMSTTQNSWKSS